MSDTSVAVETSLAERLGHHSRQKVLGMLAQGQTDRQVLAFQIASVLTQLPPDPNHPTLKPTPTLVGSLVTEPNGTGDIDIEVAGVSWPHLQEQLKDRGALFPGCKSVYLTPFDEQGKVPPDPNNPGRLLDGNVFVAVWLTFADGTKANISIPTRTFPDTNRYDSRTVKYDPAMSFADAAQRRSFAHRACGFNPLTGGIVDPHNGLQALPDKTLSIIAPGYDRDPVGLYTLIYETARHGMRLDEASRIIARAMAQDDLTTYSFDQLSTSRLAFERGRLLADPHFKPSDALKAARELGVFERDFPELLKFEGGGQLQRIYYTLDSANESARGLPKTSNNHQAILVIVLGAIYHLIAELNDTALEDNYTGNDLLNRFIYGPNPTAQEALRQNVLRSAESRRNSC